MLCRHRFPARWVLHFVSLFDGSYVSVALARVTCYCSIISDKWKATSHECAPRGFDVSRFWSSTSCMAVPASSSYVQGVFQTSELFRLLLTLNEKNWLNIGFKFVSTHAFDIIKKIVWRVLRWSSQVLTQVLTLKSFFKIIIIF